MTLPHLNLTDATNRVINIAINITEIANIEPN